VILLDKKGDVLDRIEIWEDMYKKVKDRTTLAYLNMLNSMRNDYEILEDVENAMKISKEIEQFCVYTKIQDLSIQDILLASYDTRARLGDFRAYCIALEWNRPIEKQFFLPRKRILEHHGLIQAMQDMADDYLDFLFISLPPRIGKSTLGLFFLTFMAGRFPERAILGNGHSTSLTQAFYNEVINIMTSEEYRYNAIFPNNKIVNQSAEYSYIDLNHKKRFHTLMFKSIDGGTTGLAEASNLLYCDDLIKDVEQANNPDRLEKIFYTYTSTIQDRKVQRLCKDGVYRPCPEIHIATRWSTRDVIGRLLDIYGEVNSDRIRIINIPCYDENGESNFMYDYGKGFDKEYYHQLQMAEDPVIFSAKYLGIPVERDGLVFTDDVLSFYNELPGGRPDRIVAYADVSHGGEDFFSLPIGYVYGNEVYIEDVLFENKFGGDDYIRPRVCDIIIKHNVSRFGIEKNNGGDFFATLIIKDLKDRNYRCNITTHNAPTNKSKCDRILACQNDIKGIASENSTYRIYFKSKLLLNTQPQYLQALQQLNSWNQNPSAQRKQHDDFPDSLAGLITNVLGGKVTGKASSRISLDKYGL
jgi:hypothetical protein